MVLIHIIGGFFFPPPLLWALSPACKLLIERLSDTRATLDVSFYFPKNLLDDDGPELILD